MEQEFKVNKQCYFYIQVITLASEKDRVTFRGIIFKNLQNFLPCHFYTILSFPSVHRLSNGDKGTKSTSVKVVKQIWDWLLEWSGIDRNS